MDILRKELNAIYASQKLDDEQLDSSVVQRAIERVKGYTAVNNGCCVITDCSADRCYIIGGGFCRLMGLTDAEGMCETVNSSDEDAIYSRLHPEDLVDKRMLEYEYFKQMVNGLPAQMTQCKAACTIRIRDRQGNYIYVDNTTQVMETSPQGKMWLILCCYDLSSMPRDGYGIAARIINNTTGETFSLAADERRTHILSPREKEILLLIREGKLSKQIADVLGISIHTVNRHRQNIIEKLSVGSTVEAIMAASVMKLI